MKTLGRVLIIVAVFMVAMGLTYVGVNSTASSSTSAPQFENGVRPERPGGEFEGRERGGGVVGMFFGLLKNTVVVAVVVALVAFPKNFLQQKRRTVPVRIE